MIVKFLNMLNVFRLSAVVGVVLMASSCQYFDEHILQNNAVEATVGQPKATVKDVQSVETKDLPPKSTEGSVAEPPAKKQKLENTTTEKKSAPLLNITKVDRKKNTFEFKTPFVYKTNASFYEGEQVDLDLSKTKGGMLSAYCLDTQSKRVYFRVYKKQAWGDWQELSEDKEVNNPNRKVYAPVSLLNDVRKIQFKSSDSSSSPVVFRLFAYQ